MRVTQRCSKGPAGLGMNHWGKSFEYAREDWKSLQKPYKPLIMDWKSFQQIKNEIWLEYEVRGNYGKYIISII